MPPKKDTPAPEPTSEPQPPLFPSYEGDTFTADTKFQAVTLVEGGYPGEWLVPAPIPQSLDVGRMSYDITDRKAGVYTWRHR